AGFLFAREVHFTLATDPTLPQDGVRVIGWHSSNPLDIQGEIPPIEEYDTDRPPAGAFLVVEGRRHFPLSTALIQIGRRLDNDLVIDDPRVSRQHLQLLANRGKFILHDLNSTAGTYVNGVKVKDHTLQPGDVINIATLELIYGEDTGGPPEVTPPYRPAPASEPTDDRITPVDFRITKQLRALDSDSPDKNK
ncbi:MAG: FHA domain-containing protein, partial [Chloroflexi bacterium]|nr:FHA domain-containing protein [Chloroflexota bacterium]